MKKTAFILLVLCALVLVSCGKGPEAIRLETVCSKDSVEEFMTAFENEKNEKTFSKVLSDEEHCYNVTPEQIKNETDIRIFKFSDFCGSYAFLDGEIYELCDSFGGFGFVHAVPCDFDDDGNIDLLVSSSAGSGLHTASISVFNTKTKESTEICNSAVTDPSAKDLLVISQAPISDDSKKIPKAFTVYATEIKVPSGNLVELSCTTTEVVDTIKAQNGKPVYKAAS